MATADVQTISSSTVVAQPLAVQRSDGLPHQPLSVNFITVPAGRPPVFNTTKEKSSCPAVVGDPLYPVNAISPVTCALAATPVKSNAKQERAESRLLLIT